MLCMCISFPVFAILKNPTTENNLVEWKSSEKAGNKGLAAWIFFYVTGCDLTLMMIIMHKEFLMKTYME